MPIARLSIPYFALRVALLSQPELDGTPLVLSTPPGGRSTVEDRTPEAARAWALHPASSAPGCSNVSGGDARLFGISRPIIRQRPLTHHWTVKERLKMTISSIAEARSNFAALVKRAPYGHERVVLTSHGRPAAAIISIEDLDLLRPLEDSIDVAAAREALAEAKTEGTISWDTLTAATLGSSSMP